jgi:tetratricopeptide (TPR) repeat protein
LDILERIAAGKREQAGGHDNLASVLARQGKLGEAETDYRAAVAIARTEGGTGHPALPAFISHLANILRREGKLAEARPLAEEAVAICQRHPDRVDRWAQESAFVTLRDVLTDLGDTAALEKLELTIQQTNARRKPAPTPEPPLK